MTDSKDDSAWGRNSGDLGKVGIFSSAPYLPLRSAAPSSARTPDHLHPLPLAVFKDNTGC